MLRKDVNDLLTQTSSGTPMGSMFRQYWIPGTSTLIGVPGLTSSTEHRSIRDAEPLISYSPVEHRTGVTLEDGNKRTAFRMQEQLGAIWL